MSSKDDSIICEENDIIDDMNAGECNTSANFFCVDGNHLARDGYVESGDQPPLQQLRTFLQCFDNQMAHHTIFLHPLYIEISLSIIESKDAET